MMLPEFLINNGAVTCGTPKATCAGGLIIPIR